MSSFLMNDLGRYLPRHSIPLYVEEVLPGAHPARQMHGHTFQEIVLILAGEGVHVAEGEEAEIRAGDVLQVHPGISHGYDRTATLGLVNLVYDPHRLSLPLLDGGMMPLFSRLMAIRRPAAKAEEIALPLLRLTPREMKPLAAKVKRLAAELESNRPGRSFMSMALFMEIITGLCRCEDAPTVPDRAEFLVGDAIRHMHEHLAEPIAIDELPTLVNLSRRSFFRLFRNATGRTPGEYLKELRFARAVELLRRTDLSVTEVALRCGFCDGNYVCRLFRERLGTTPRQFRAAPEKGGKRVL